MCCEKCVLSKIERALVFRSITNKRFGTKIQKKRNIRSMKSVKNIWRKIARASGWRDTSAYRREISLAD
jgi:hypothetical protein